MGLQAITPSSQSPGEHSSSLEIETTQEESSIDTINTRTTLGLSSCRGYGGIAPITPIGSSSMEVDGNLQHPKQVGSSFPTCTPFPPSSSMPMMAADELHRLVDYQPIYAHQTSQIFPSPASQLASLGLSTLPNSLTTFSDKLWEWNPIPDANRDYTTFKWIRIFLSIRQIMSPFFSIPFSSNVCNLLGQLMLVNILLLTYLGFQLKCIHMYCTLNL